MSFLPKGIIERYKKILNPQAGKIEVDDRDVYLFLKERMNTLPKMPAYMFDRSNSPLGTAQQQQQLAQQQGRIQINRKDSSDRFFVIRYELQKLKSYQEMILNIMEQLKYEFVVIPIDRSKLGIDPSNQDNVFTLNDCKMSSRDLYKKRFYQGTYRSFDVFIQHYQELSYSLFRSINQPLVVTDTGIPPKGDMPLFYRMINIHYKGKAKKFVLKMLNEYIKVGGILQKMQREFYGIMSYEQVFDISKTPQIKIFKQNTTTYKNDFNQNFNNDAIYNETSGNQNMPSQNQNLPNQTSDEFDYMMLDFQTNLYDQVGNEYLYTNLCKNRLESLLEKIQELMKKIYTTKKQNLYELFKLIFQLDYYTQEFIFYYTSPETYRKSILIKDSIYQWISAHIEIYENFIAEFIYWIKAIGKSANEIGIQIQDPRLTDIFKTFTQFYHDLFDKTKEERANSIQTKLREMGITYEVKIPDSFDTLSDAELTELNTILDQLEQILR